MNVRWLSFRLLQLVLLACYLESKILDKALLTSLRYVCPIFYSEDTHTVNTLCFFDIFLTKLLLLSDVVALTKYCIFLQAPFMKAVNAMTVGLSLMALLLYGTTLSYIGLRIDYNIAYNNLPDDDPNKNKYHIMGKQLTPVDVNADDDMLQGIMGTICFLSLVEMFLGSFMILLDTECMFVRGSQAAGRQVSDLCNNLFI